MNVFKFAQTTLPLVGLLAASFGCADLGGSSDKADALETELTRVYVRHDCEDVATQPFKILSATATSRVLELVVEYEGHEDANYRACTDGNYYGPAEPLLNLRILQSRLRDAPPELHRTTVRIDVSTLASEEVTLLLRDHDIEVTKPELENYGVAELEHSLAQHLESVVYVSAIEEAPMFVSAPYTGEDAPGAVELKTILGDTLVDTFVNHTGLDYTMAFGDTSGAARLGVVSYSAERGEQFIENLDLNADDVAEHYQWEAIVHSLKWHLGTPRVYRVRPVSGDKSPVAFLVLGPLSDGNLAGILMMAQERP